MNSQLLEFWGNSLMNMGRGQRQLDSVNQWINHSLSGFDKLTNSMFHTLNRINESFSDPPEYMKMWNKSAEEAGKSVQNLLNISSPVGIPEESHQALVNKYEALKKKCEDQEETIKQLKKMMQSEKNLGQFLDKFSDHVSDQGSVVKNFQNLIEQQNDQFQKLISLSDKFFKPSSTSQKKGKTVQNKGKSTVKKEKK